MSIDEQDSTPSEPLGETANPEELTSEGTCTVVLHPGDVLEYDPAEYFISEKDFQVKYECTINRKQRLQAKKSKTLLNPVPENAIDRFKRKINELSDTVGNHGDMMIKRFKENVTAQQVEYDLEAGEG